jgi:hypothetical protein
MMRIRRNCSLCVAVRGEFLVPPDPNDSPLHSYFEAEHDVLWQNADALQSIVRSNSAATGSEHGLGALCITMLM